jgi:hypothetical protein
VQKLRLAKEMYETKAHGSRDDDRSPFRVQVISRELISFRPHLNTISMAGRAGIRQLCWRLKSSIYTFG